MRKAVETNGLTAVSIDLGGTTHVTLYLLHRVISHCFIFNSHVSQTHTLQTIHHQNLSEFLEESFGAQPTW